MMGNSSERQCPDDLVVRGQRQELSDFERRALLAHLGQCASCRAASALTALFDAIPETQPGDDDLITRVRDKATRMPRRVSRWVGLRAAAVAVLAVLSGGVATAAWIAHKRAVDPMREAPAPKQQARLSFSRARSVPPAVPPPIPVVQEPPTGALDRQEGTAAGPPRRHRESSRTADLAPPIAEPTPASLFAHANAVRRSGNVRKAIGLYQTLRERYPDSSQALLSAVSMGDLLLGEGDPTDAIAAYGAYLRGSPKGSLTEEALFGRARGFALLGRGAEERQTWEDLLRRFPHSAYQLAASRRLKELAR
jgi:TolA-binding protein